MLHLERFNLQLAKCNRPLCKYGTWILHEQHNGKFFVRPDYIINVTKVCMLHKRVQHTIAGTNKTSASHYCLYSFEYVPPSSVWAIHVYMYTEHQKKLYIFINQHNPQMNSTLILGLLKTPCESGYNS